MLTDVNIKNLKNKNYLNDIFINAHFSSLSISCNILKGSFFSDSFHYFPITNNDQTFSSLYFRNYNDISNFYSEKFIIIF